MPVIQRGWAITVPPLGESMELNSIYRGSRSAVPARVDDMGEAIDDRLETDGDFHFVIHKS